MNGKIFGATGRKIMLLLAGLVFLALLGLRLLPPAASLATNPPFELVEVRRGTLENIVSSTGTLAAVETVAVGTQVSGTISRLQVDYNNRVKKGQVLAVLDQSLFEAVVREAEAAVAKSRAELAQAEDQYRRNKPLFAQGYLSEQEFLPLRTGVDTAKADLASAEAGLKRARTNLGYTVICSPIDGTVIERSVDAGQTVAASLNTPTLFIIARDLAHMQIEADVDESDIGQIRDGQAVRFTVQAYPDKTFTGKVSQIRLQPKTISNVVNYTVVVKAENDQGLLLPGMTATVDFVVARVENTLLVPNAALRFKPTAAMVDRLPTDSVGIVRAPASPSGETALLYYLDKMGRAQVATVVRGETDGVSTVVEGSAIAEGTQVLTGLKLQAKAEKKTLFSFLRPPGRSGSGSPR